MIQVPAKILWGVSKSKIESLVSLIVINCDIIV